MMTDFIIAAAGTLASWLGIAYVKRWLWHHRVLDVPNDRSSHSAPVPRGGGVMIAAIVITGILFQIRHSPMPIAIAWVGGSALIASISWLDDLRSLPTLARLIAHAAAAVIVVTTAGPLESIGTTALGFVAFSGGAYALSILWIVGLTNAFNFMDGIDGMAGGQAAIAGAAAVLAGHIQGDRVVESVGLLIAGTSAGFLIHNWSPATIFMGDVGSAFLGYLLAVIPLMSTNSRAQLLFVAVGSLWPFLFDTSFTFVRRLLKGENVIRAHRTHLYQRLVQSGLSHASVSLLYITCASIGSALAILALRSAAFGVLTLVSMPLTAMLLLAIVWIRDRQKTSAATVTDSGRPAYHESQSPNRC